mmetsp:Transcript_14721/g.16556  ORF Transcript_14721/g.16556 Transcript_14721/m.16556 type:complete len:89 (-) Transcript_14721:54-320(-)
MKSIIIDLFRIHFVWFVVVVVVAVAVLFLMLCLPVLYVKSKIVCARGRNHFYHYKIHKSKKQPPSSNLKSSYYLFVLKGVTVVELTLE